MGMGEPLANYKNVLAAVRRMNTEIGIGARHITISTVGLVPRIERLAQEGLQVKLAVSLHAATDQERNEIMPVNVRFPLKDLIQACKNYVRDTGRRVTFEWALIAGKVCLSPLNSPPPPLIPQVFQRTAADNVNKEGFSDAKATSGRSMS